MDKSKQKSAKPRKPAAGDGGFHRLDGFLLNSVGDSLDLRDYAYRPALVQLKKEIPRPKNLTILNQGREGACTGFGLAAVINLLLRNRKEKRMVSARMLYEIAKKFDEWDGEDYSGSSCRGAILGWYNSGVCSEELAQYKATEQNWQLTIQQAKDARKTTLGAYYRLEKRISDFHAALNEVEAIYVSARVHEGWQTRNVKNGVIPLKTRSIGGHAFAIVGYNARGFLVQNSWGPGWGDNGVALWTYEDWLENIRDAWVVRLSLSTPQIWHLTPSTASQAQREQGLFKKSPTRAEIVGHFVHIDDGDFDDKGKYWMNLHSIKETAHLVATDTRYDHLLFYAHGGLNSIKDSARRIAAMKEIFKSNGIYPFHFMYDTGLLEEIKDVILGKKDEVEGKMGGFSDFSDALIETITRPLGRALWREMKSGAQRPFEPHRDGVATIDAFLAAFGAKGAKAKTVHIIGHSTGAILLARLLQALEKFSGAPRVATCSLLAPACTHSIFKDVYLPFLKEREATAFGIDRMKIYNLDNALERKDTVTPLYRKSLLYLVSNAFEEQKGTRILGMQKFKRYLRNLPGSKILGFEISDGSPSSSANTGSTTHGGFDNDKDTMNDILKSVLGEPPKRPFTRSDLDY